MAQPQQGLSATAQAPGALVSMAQPPQGANSGPDSDFTTFSSCVKLWYHRATFGLTSITFETSNCCESCCGEARTVIAAHDVTSFSSAARQRCWCLRGAALTLRSGAANAASTPLPYTDLEAALEALQVTLRTARSEPAGFPPKNFIRGGEVNCHTAKDCTTRLTDWRFGPGSAVEVRVTESNALLPCFFKRASTSGSALAHVRTTQAYSPVGLCACKQTPSGRCSCDEFISLGLGDDTSLYGGALKGDARFILDELALRRREASGAPSESTAFVLRGTDVFECCGAECELKVTTERVTLAKHTQSPLVRGLTGSLCVGVYEETLLLEDIVSIDSSKPTPCELAGAILSRMAWAAKKLLAALEVSATPLGIVSGLLLLALAASITIYFLDLEVFEYTQNYIGWAGPQSTLRNIPVVGSLDEVLIIVTAVALFLFVVLVRGADPLVLVGLLLGLSLVRGLACAGGGGWPARPLCMIHVHANQHNARNTHTPCPPPFAGPHSCHLCSPSIPPGHVPLLLKDVHYNQGRVRQGVLPPAPQD